MSLPETLKESKGPSVLTAIQKLSQDDVVKLSRELETNKVWKELQLHESGLTDDGLAAISESLKVNHTLEILELCGNTLISDKGLSALAEMLKMNRTLTHLVLGSLMFARMALIGSAGLTALAEALKVNMGLTTLDLSYLMIGDEGVKLLSTFLDCNSTLKVLILSNNDISCTGVMHLVEGLKLNSTIEILSLDSNEVGDRGAIALAELLRMTNCWKKLELSVNEIQNNGAVALAHALKRNRSLVELNLSENKISDPGAYAIAQALQDKPNSSSFLIDLRYNDISGAATQALEVATPTNAVKALTPTSASSGFPSSSSSSSASLSSSTSSSPTFSFNPEDLAQRNAQKLEILTQALHLDHSKTEHKLEQEIKEKAKRFNSLQHRYRQLELECSEYKSQAATLSTKLGLLEQKLVQARSQIEKSDVQKQDEQVKRKNAEGEKEMCEKLYQDALQSVDQERKMRKDQDCALEDAIQRCQTLERKVMRREEEMKRMYSAEEKQKLDFQEQLDRNTKAIASLKAQNARLHAEASEKQRALIAEILEGKSEIDIHKRQCAATQRTLDTTTKKNAELNRELKKLIKLGLQQISSSSSSSTSSSPSPSSSSPKQSKHTHQTSSRNKKIGRNSPGSPSNSSKSQSNNDNIRNQNNCNNNGSKKSSKNKNKTSSQGEQNPQKAETKMNVKVNAKGKTKEKRQNQGRKKTERGVTDRKKETETKQNEKNQAPIETGETVPSGRCNKKSSLLLTVISIIISILCLGFYLITSTLSSSKAPRRQRWT